MTPDPIVAECGPHETGWPHGSIMTSKPFFRHVKAAEAKSGRSYVQCPPRTLAPREEDAGERDARTEGHRAAERRTAP